ncbi:hypothetical protein CHRYSEOSP005_27860 [Chryseobacterium sp. Alg-005]|uniref:helix-turn-helix domain-containing protein n=1 Tax=Chryseobacterium sp. Alg-005 TaxID=3159516 RepID=UPI003555A1B7
MNNFISIYLLEKYIMSTLGTKLTRMRQAKKLSQSEVALHLDVSQSAYNKWESDQSKPTAENLLKICEFYDADIFDLLDEGRSIVYSNNTFENSNIFNNTENPIFNMQSPELTKLIELQAEQNKLIEVLIRKITN